MIPEPLYPTQCRAPGQGFIPEPGPAMSPLMLDLLDSSAIPGEACSHHWLTSLSCARCGWSLRAVLAREKAQEDHSHDD